MGHWGVIGLVLCAGLAPHTRAFYSLAPVPLPPRTYGGTCGASSCPAGPVSFHTRARLALRLADEDAPQGDGAPKPDVNATADWEKNLGMELLRARRPIGVDDLVEGIRQASDDDKFIILDAKDRAKNNADAVYPAYDSGTSENGGVGNKIGLEKNTGDYSDGLFADNRRGPMSGRDQVRETENSFVGAFAQEKNFIGGLIGLALLALFYVSVYNGNGGNMNAPRYGEGGVPPGEGKVIERYEEAFLCYGVPSPTDPSGCRDKRSVGPVRVFSRAPAPGAPIAGAAAGDEGGGDGSEQDGAAEEP